jgi:hypothetical protein
VIAAKKNFLTQWQVVSCRVNVDGVTRNLAKSQAAIREASERFEEKSEGGNCATQSPGGLPQQDS